jgi:putative DNA primase/helicase
MVVKNKAFAGQGEGSNICALERPSNDKGQGVTMLRASDLPPEPINWYWLGYLAAGKLHLLAGSPGTGKTTTALAFAAIMSAGGLWPDGSRCPKRRAVIWSGEDDPNDTLVPRLIAAGADLDYVHFVGPISRAGQVGRFDPALHMDLLQRELTSMSDVGLLILDPIVSAVAGDSHKGAEVRRHLDPLVQLGLRVGCAVLGITHFSKNSSDRDTVDRVLGSVAFAAATRLILVCVKKEVDDSNAALHFLIREKSNIGRDRDGFSYRLEQSPLATHPDIIASKVVWVEEVSGTTKSILRGGNSSAPQSATDLIRDKLSSGQKCSFEDLLKACEPYGFQEHRVRSALRELGAIKGKSGNRGGWTWHIPPRPTG